MKKYRFLMLASFCMMSFGSAAYAQAQHQRKSLVIRPVLIARESLSPNAHDTTPDRIADNIDRAVDNFNILAKFYVGLEGYGPTREDDLWATEMMRQESTALAALIKLAENSLQKVVPSNKPAPANYFVSRMVFNPGTQVGKEWDLGQARRNLGAALSFAIKYFGSQDGKSNSFLMKLDTQIDELFAEVNALENSGK